MESWIDPWYMSNGITISPLGYMMIESIPVPPPPSTPPQVQCLVDTSALEQIKKVCIEACKYGAQQSSHTRTTTHKSREKEVVEEETNPISVTSSITDPSFQEIKKM